jgi:cobyrinic acid a,c-diamide synthase
MTPSNRTLTKANKGPSCLIVAGSHSGVGKTTLTLGLLAAFQKRGLKVQGFKVGPDFIDPGHHARLTGLSSRNLDGWMLSERYNRAVFSKAMEGKDLGVVEGVMGLFDGYDGLTEAGSTAQMSKWIGAPVLLVVDASSMARSIAALVYGFAAFDKDLRLAAVIANRVGSSNHLRYLSEAMVSVPEVVFLGGLPRTQEIAIPERHLGLVTSDEYPYSGDLFDRLSVLVEDHLDLDAILDFAAPGVEPTGISLPEPDQSGVRLGVARDEAFCFYYQDNLDLLNHFGAELCFFSPIRDTRLPANLAGLYLGGGYPELYARQLQQNKGMRAEILAAAGKGMPMYAECGGFMYLTRSIQVNDLAFEMVGLYPFDTRMLPRRKALGYREVVLSKDSLLGPRGLTARGHEFHYSELTDEPREVPVVFQVNNREGRHVQTDGFMMHNVVAGYIHLHFGSNPDIAAHFVERCQEYQDSC